MRRLRVWLASRAYAFGWWIDPARQAGAGPRCPDCKIGPDVEPCEVCEAERERQRIEDSIYEAGHNDGYREAEDAFGGGLIS